jgi:hypothetical protein
MNGSRAPKNTPAAGGPTGPTGSRAMLASKLPAPKSYGKGKYKVIEPAPGRYVKAKA